MERRLGRMIRSMSVTGMVGFSGVGTGWEPAVDMFETPEAVRQMVIAAVGATRLLPPDEAGRDQGHCEFFRQNNLRIGGNNQKFVLLM